MKPPNLIIEELKRKGFSLEDAEEALRHSRANPLSVCTVARTVITAFNKGEDTVPIYIAVQLAMEVLRHNKTNNTEKQDG